MIVLDLFQLTHKLMHIVRTREHRLLHIIIIRRILSSRDGVALQLKHLTAIIGIQPMFHMLLRGVDNFCNDAR